MCCTSCFRGPFTKAINDKEITQYLPILREDYPLIIEKLEILRLGICGEEEYRVVKRNNDSLDYEIVILRDNQSFNFEESPNPFPPEEIDAINYLFLSEDLKLNAYYISYREAYWPGSMGSPGAKFAKTKDADWHIGIYYFEDNKIPGDLQNKWVYTEELADYYWIVISFMQRE